MRRLILAGLIALMPAIAFARAPMETNQLVDGNGNPIGTADNPLKVTGDGTANPYPGSDYATSGRQDAMNAALGAPADAAYGGSGSGSAIALSKGQYAILSALAAAYGSPSDAAATTGNGSVIAIEKAIRDRLASGVIPQDGVAATGAPFALTSASTQTGFRTAGYNSVSIELTGTFTMTVTVETSSDSTDGVNGTWSSSSNGNALNDQGTTNGFSTLSAGRPRMVFPVTGAPWMRLRVSAYTSGSAQAYVYLRSAPYVAHDVYVGGGTVTVPGVATAANQATELASLATIAQRALLYTDVIGQAVAANGTYIGTARDLGATPAYTRMNVALYSAQNGTVTIQACQDATCGNAFTVAVQQVVVNTSVWATVSAPVYTRYMRVIFQNGSTAGNITVSSSFTAN